MLVMACRWQTTATPVSRRYRQHVNSNLKYWVWAQPAPAEKHLQLMFFQTLLQLFETIWSCDMSSDEQCMEYLKDKVMMQDPPPNVDDLEAYSSHFCLPLALT